MSNTKIYVNAWDTLSAAGRDADLKEALLRGEGGKLTPLHHLVDKTIYFGKIEDQLIKTPDEIRTTFPSVKDLHLGRGNCIAATLAESLVYNVKTLSARYGAHRIAVVIGTSVAGMTETEQNFLQEQQPTYVDSTELEIFNPARFLQACFNLSSVAYVISTACTSSTKALASAARLIQADIVDAVICGGIDAMSIFTIKGFSALGVLSDNPCRPFSEHRNGINLAEAGALFILSKVPSDIVLSGWGETSDAYHISSPDPAADSVCQAIKQALSMAGINGVDYVNAHGTATAANDAMEALAIAQSYAPTTPVSSTKALTGHALGAAGALEAAICCHTLQQNFIPGNFCNDALDPQLPAVNLVRSGYHMERIHHVSSHNFAFGGNNAVLFFSRS